MVFWLSGPSSTTSSNTSTTVTRWQGRPSFVGHQLRTVGVVATFLLGNITVPPAASPNAVVWTRGRNEIEAEDHAQERERDRGLEYAMAQPVSSLSTSAIAALGADDSWTNMMRTAQAYRRRPLNRPFPFHDDTPSSLGG